MLKTIIKASHQITAAPCNIRESNRGTFHLLVESGIVPTCAKSKLDDHSKETNYYMKKAINFKKEQK